jgi:hypothetical protein
MPPVPGMPPKPGSSGLPPKPVTSSGEGKSSKSGDKSAEAARLMPPGGKKTSSSSSTKTEKRPREESLPPKPFTPPEPETKPKTESKPKADFTPKTEPKPKTDSPKAETPKTPKFSDGSLSMPPVPGSFADEPPKSPAELAASATKTSEPKQPTEIKKPSEFTAPTESKPETEAQVTPPSEPAAPKPPGDFAAPKPPGEFSKTVEKDPEATPAPRTSEDTPPPSPPGSFGDETTEDVSAPAPTPPWAMGDGSESAPRSEPQMDASVASILPAPLPPGALAAVEKALSPEDREIEEVAPTELKFKEKPKTVGQGFEKRELKRLTPEERTKRRRQRNIVIGMTGLLMLGGFLGLLYYLSR